MLHETSLENFIRMEAEAAVPKLFIIMNSYVLL